MLDTETFRSVMGSFATGVTVLTFPGEEHGMTANAFSSVSLDPPLLLVCIDHETTSYELLQNREVDSFCVNMLAASQHHLGEYFADMRDLDESPFDSEPTESAVSGAPIFTDSLAFADCEIWDSTVAGDHTIYIGEVKDAGILDDEADALTFFRGSWGSLS